MAAKPGGGHRTFAIDAISHGRPTHVANGHVTNGHASAASPSVAAPLSHKVSPTLRARGFTIYAGTSPHPTSKHNGGDPAGEDAVGTWEFSMY